MRIRRSRTYLSSEIVINGDTEFLGYNLHTTGELIPDTTGVSDIGSAAKVYNNVHANAAQGNLRAFILAAGFLGS